MNFPQGTYLRRGGVVTNQIKKGLLLSLLVGQLKSVNIIKSYEREGSCLVHFVRLAITLLKDEESARDNHVLQCSLNAALGYACQPRARCRLAH